MKYKIYYKILKNHFISASDLGYKQKFFFIHIPKNAGTAITYSEVLDSYLVMPTIFSYPKSYLFELRKAIGFGNYAHGRYKDFRIFIKNNYKFVVVIRNPWSRCVSKYLFGLKVLKQKKLEIPKKLKTFENYIESSFEFKEKDYFWHKVVDGWYTQKSYIEGINEDRLKIIRFEHLDKDFGDLMKEKNKNFSRENKLKRMNKTSVNFDDYKKFYNNNLINRVYDLYKEDVEYFNFDFDTSLNKNKK
ncbi:hypothetical protein [Candidatus Pelagibacter sp. HIMB1709]|uniref:hypothetical protein n=1 Tax=Candidatus Pelagibacter sp. HIMB1709 TaxID=3413367 RepID=UPI003F85A104